MTAKKKATFQTIVNEHLPAGDRSPVGLKKDGGKPRWSLLPWRAVAAVVDVLEFGAAKYKPGNWRHVENGKQRYFDAAMRHLLEYQMAREAGRDVHGLLDPESKLHVLAHAACDLLFLLALEIEG